MPNWVAGLLKLCLRVSCCHNVLSPSFSRDRVAFVWQAVRDHLYHLCVNAVEYCFLVERAVVGLLRLAIRLLRREEISAQVKGGFMEWSALIVGPLVHSISGMMTFFLEFCG